MTIEIRKLGPEDVATYRALRLRATREHPEAYLASFEEEDARSVEEDRRRLAAQEGRDDAFVLAAFEDGSPVGMTGGLRQTPDHAKGRHKALIWGVYVAPEARGRGVGRQLMDAAVRALSKAGGIELIHLGVGTYNTPAKALYKSVGFETWGVEARAIRLGDRFIDEEMMVLFLPRPESEDC